jgi:hypothetical protein
MSDRANAHATAARGAVAEAPSGFARGVAAVLGVITVAIGAWALLAPQSFYDTIATFPPYNRHFLHDVGAFQLGLGAALLLALRVRDGLVVALGGYAVGGLAHAVSHLVDRDLGGRPAFDITSLTVLAALAILAIAARRRAPNRS